MSAETAAHSLLFMSVSPFHIKLLFPKDYMVMLCMKKECIRLLCKDVSHTWGGGGVDLMVEFDQACQWVQQGRWHSSVRCEVEVNLCTVAWVCWSYHLSFYFWNVEIVYANYLTVKNCITGIHWSCSWLMWFSVLLTWRSYWISPLYCSK